MEPPVIPFFYDFRDEDFCSLSNKIFRYQLNANTVYGNFIHQFHEKILEDIEPVAFPFLPINFFKTHEVYCGNRPDLYFESSGTGRQQLSKHYVSDLSVYESSFTAAFHLAYGAAGDYCMI